MLKNVLSALYLLKGRTDFNQTCTDISFGDAEEVSKFGDLDSNIKVSWVKKC